MTQVWYPFMLSEDRTAKLDDYSQVPARDSRSEDVLRNNLGCDNVYDGPLQHY
jgi:hypothetical protein